MATRMRRSNRRGTLLSTSRTTRAFAASNVDSTLLVGTSRPIGGNKLQILNCGASGESLELDREYACDEEVWGCAYLDRQEGGPRVAVALRERSMSAMSIWELPSDVRDESDTQGAASLDSGAVAGTSETPGYHPKILASINVLDGKVCGIDTNSAGSVLYYSSRGVWVSSMVDAQASGIHSERMPVSEAVVSARFCQEQSVILVATTTALQLHDVRSKSTDPLLVLRVGDLAKSRSNATEEGSTEPKIYMLARKSRFSSASAGEGHIVAAGSEDGGLCAADVRCGTRMPVWSVDDRAAHSHWVTSVAVGPADVVASGGTDGVARAWTSNGKAAGTYPIHDDAIYGLEWSRGDTLASCSYDGRVSLSPRPVGMD